MVVPNFSLPVLPPLFEIWVGGLFFFTTGAVLVLEQLPVPLQSVGVLHVLYCRSWRRAMIGPLMRAVIITEPIYFHHDWTWGELKDWIWEFNLDMVVLTPRFVEEDYKWQATPLHRCRTLALLRRVLPRCWLLSDICVALVGGGAAVTLGWFILRRIVWVFGRHDGAT